MRSGMFFIVCLGLMVVSPLSFATSQAEEKRAVGPDSAEQELEEVDLESRQRLQLERDLRRSNIRLGFGMALTSIGATTVLFGVGIIIVSGIDAANDDPDNSGMGPSLAFLAGGIFAGIGLIPLVIGIPLLKSGYKKRKSLMKKLSDMPSISIAAGGVYDTRLLTLNWRF